ncbi:TPA: carbamoyltransferase HypF [Salmonella enterica subsp. houtenae serovar 43:z4,z32:-]|uniref:Carbamoyltransferase HypF n=3 Tax=Salmonella enterica TaxID=28901 RepID=A0A5U2TK34_SALER|nr:carbamoyltransferase HypF [Salmonella enterica subsp. houtenae]EAM4409525.1 carbamoyltransferase HypF [Salmonella enterica]ECG1388965.1 carbamoyltransferase HypF [Salmonella enterica subsp. houtenae str. CFSAN000557]EDT6510912.1 carbamoyltransferase HypF [Salmonella enterica subsp. enterica serovar Tallahassee]HAE4737476.1 carbamoyltransferase HypF [Salmonella enterica subsp. houtenae serovar 41:z4,z23:-]HAE7764978.1 carbamoyltransferase HypF [Salmonella enterica subsp. houtenae serovar 45:
MAIDTPSGVQLRIRGKVQGVGFRPFVWQLAQQLRLHGDVCNDGDGVVVRLLEEPSQFIAALYQDCPPLARIDSVEHASLIWERTPTDFAIRQSAGGSMNTQIVPDAATCPACLAEMNTPGERRYRYPFINCTHCGPRFTIIRAMPYDRPFTVMAAFPLCPECDSEYRDPYDRRFHAQPVACPACGPHLEWRSQHERAEKEAALQAAVGQLNAGGIIAVKGLGGFHLACDARNDTAVAMLRARKHRPAKPLAVMLPTAQTLPTAARSLLTTPAAPIVLVDKQYVPSLSEGVAPGLAEVGVMLPANPLQHLLLQELNYPLVMTSGNLSGRPPAITNEQALDDLHDIADGFLLHNRDIVQRMDDSVVRDSGEMLRRSRGYVPDAFALPPGFRDAPPILCLGADLKNTFCLVRGEQAVVSQHLGDLSDDGIQAQWREALRLIQSIYDFTPERIVCDAHPGYVSSQWASEMCLPTETVLHHHAHAAACLAEHGWPLDGGEVIALTVDGIGMGENGALWGGECLRVNYRECEHLGGLPAVALPGGDLAAKQPWRNLLAQCLRFVPDWQDYPETAGLQQQNWNVLARAIERGVNAPLASSCGRLFDAVAAALRCAPASLSYEGEAACALEALASQCANVEHPVTMPLNGVQLDVAAFWRQWLNWQATPAQRAWAFHDALACGFAMLMRQQATARGITTLVFSGGVIHNRLLRARLTFYLSDFNLLFPQQLPAGDGGLSLGQGVIAAARRLA